MYNLLCFWMETHYLPFSELLTTARTGQPAAERYLGQPFFDWSAADPERAALQSRAMAEVTAGLRTGMFDTYTLPAGDLIADIGGADGSVLVELLTHHPDRRGIVFDLPAVVPSAHATLAHQGLDDRVTVTVGDFFDTVPTADIYLLGWILHDWDDESSLRILHTIATAVTRSARLLVIEGIVPADDSPHLTKMIDLTMLGVVTGKERTAQEYRELLDRAGFTVNDIVTTPSPFSIIEATLR